MVLADGESTMGSSVESAKTSQRNSKDLEPAKASWDDFVAYYKEWRHLKVLQIAVVVSLGLIYHSL